jgi:hypothetical protein
MKRGTVLLLFSVVLLFIIQFSGCGVPDEREEKRPPKTDEFQEKIEEPGTEHTPDDGAVKGDKSLERKSPERPEGGGE